MFDESLESDKGGVKCTCASSRKPGGQIADPNNAFHCVPNPGFEILVPAICGKSYN